MKQNTAQMNRTGAEGVAGVPCVRLFVILSHKSHTLRAIHYGINFAETVMYPAPEQPGTAALCGGLATLRA